MTRTITPFALTSLLMLAVGLTLCLSGCATTRALSPNGPPNGEVVVFGAFDPGSNTWWKSGWDHSAAVDIIDVRTSKILFSHPLRGKNNEFYWHLPPGEYAILGIEVKGGDGLSLSRVFAEFSVPSTGGPVYIGDLVRLEANGQLLWRVQDEQANAVQALKAKYPNLPENITKSLLKLEERK
jgi:hypothetical protein